MSFRPGRPAPSDNRAAALLQTAVVHQQAGRLNEAAAIYRQILAAAPGHFDAKHLLVPAGPRDRQLVIRDRQRSALHLIQPAQLDHRDFGVAKLSRCQQPCMTGDHYHVRAD